MNLMVRPHHIGIDFFRKNTIKRRLFFYFFSLVVLPLIFLGFVAYFTATNALEANIVYNSSVMIDQLSMHLELYFQQYERVSLFTLGNEFARDFLNAPGSEAAGLSSHLSQMQAYLNPIISGNYEIEGVFLARPDGWVTGVSKQGNEPFLRKEPWLLKKINWLGELPQDGSVLISGVHPSVFGYGSPTISLARRISPPGNPQKTEGIFWIDINLQKIKDICEQVRLGKSGHLSIIDSSGKIIYDPNPGLIRHRYPFMFRHQVMASYSGNFQTDVEGFHSLVIYNTFHYTNWRLIAVVPYLEIASSVLRLKHITGWVIVLCLAASFLMAITFAASITRPIKKLQQTMEEASKGYLDRVIPVESTDEVGKLTENFNQMLQKIQTLISDNYTSRIRQAEAESRQHHAELLSLQAQINPHFLYNTLGTISSLAVLEGVVSISEMTGTLSDFFRYSIHSEEMMVTLEDELAQVERYFSIQKIRFGNRISMDIRIPEALLKHEIIKLTVQPLVENACIHGLELYGEGKILIDSNIIGNTLAILVSDTGTGIEETKLQVLQALLEHPEAGDETNNHIGIGLRNVNYRLKLHYGNEYGLKIESDERRGTTVAIYIPFQETANN